jgi:FlaA1/EpsC-like NDP-sugar epimerase
MVGRRQEINLQLTELTDSGLLAVFSWFGHYLRSELALHFLPNLGAIPPFSESLWLLAVIVPFTPVILVSRGFYTNLISKTPARSIRQLPEALVIVGIIISALSIFVRWQVPSRAVLILGLSLGVLAIFLRESCQRISLRRRIHSGVGREPVLIAGLTEDMDRLLESMNLETGMERDEDGVVLGSTRLPGSQRLHRKDDATREAGSLVGPMPAADSPSAISVFRFRG